MYRTYKEEKDGSADEEDKDSKREPQRWDLDYDLEPYEGLSPEYMEMGEYHMLKLNNLFKWLLRLVHRFHYSTCFECRAS